MQFRSIVWSNQDVLATWLCKRIGLVPTANLKCLGRVDKDGQIMGVIGYDGYNLLRLSYGRAESVVVVF